MIAGLYQPCIRFLQFIGAICAFLSFIMVGSNHTMIASLGLMTIEFFYMMIAAGYLAHDLILCLRNRDSFGDASTIAHHVVIICAYLLSILCFRQLASFYMATLLIQEISTPCVNLRWWLRFHSSTDNVVYLANFVVTTVLFLLARVLFGLYVIVHIAESYQVVWDEYSAEPYWTRRYFDFATLLAVMQFALNVMWFFMVCRATARVFGRRRKEHRAKKD
eukprot:Rmarinus@m.17762